VIRKLVYVGCDMCGDPIGTDMGDDAREARAHARRAGGTRIRHGGRLFDLCHRCSPSSEAKP
jgi:hypothetical protein